MRKGFALLWAASALTLAASYEDSERVQSACPPPQGGQQKEELSASGESESASFSSSFSSLIEESGQENVRKSPYLPRYNLPTDASSDQVREVGRDDPADTLSDAADFENMPSDESQPEYKDRRLLIDEYVKNYQTGIETKATQDIENDERGWIIDTFAGAGDFAGTGFGDVDGRGNKARFRTPRGVCTIPIANAGFVVAEAISNRLKHITPDGEVTTLAGSRLGESGYRDGPYSTALFNIPLYVAADRSGRIFVSDKGNECIRMLFHGQVVTALGTFTDNGKLPAFDDRRIGPRGIACDKHGNLIYADARGFCVKKLAPNGDVTHIAGNGFAGSTDGPTGKNSLFNPDALAVDRKNNVYVTTRPLSPYTGALYGHRVRKIDPDGECVTYPVSSAQRLLFPWGILPSGESDNSVFVADTVNNIIRRVMPAISTEINKDETAIKEDAKEDEKDDEDEAKQKQIEFDPEPLGKARIFDMVGNYDADLRSGEGRKARLAAPCQMCRTSNGEILVADSVNNRIRRLRFVGNKATAAQLRAEMSPKVEKTAKQDEIKTLME